VTCWPYSKHTTGEQPGSGLVRVLDPQGIYVGGALDCAGTSVGTINDFLRSPVETGPVPLDAARRPSAVFGRATS
jgi:hypothetical protein